jgi:hypothetical protein
VIRDEVDVADLASEAEHEYALFGATQADDRCSWPRTAGSTGAVRTKRGAFVLTSRPGIRWVARWVASEPVHLEIAAEGVQAALDLEGTGAWEEREISLPAEAPDRALTVTVRATGSTTFAALHYWAVE